MFACTKRHLYHFLELESKTVHGELLYYAFYNRTKFKFILSINYKTHLLISQCIAEQQNLPKKERLSIKT